MGIKLTKLPDLCTENLSESESHLWLLLRETEECIQELFDEIARLKGEKGKPKIKPSRLEPTGKAPQPEDEAQESPDGENSDTFKKKKRPGSAKRHKTAELPIHETKVIQPLEEIPPDSEFKGYQDYTVQELIVQPHNILYRLARWKTPIGEILSGELPTVVRTSGHFGVMLRSYLLYQYHYMAKQKLPKKLWYPLSLSINRVFKDQDEWSNYLFTIIPVSKTFENS